MPRSWTLAISSTLTYIHSPTKNENKNQLLETNNKVAALLGIVDINGVQGIFENIKELTHSGSVRSMESQKDI